MKIEIFKPFGEAFDLTKKILFEPFDLRKWCVIGFAAFLAGNFGGISFRFPSSFGNEHADRAKYFVRPDLHQWQPWLPFVIIVFAATVLAVVLVMIWVTSRGRFIFTDCIVRNRAAIVGPWREYRKEGDSYFWFQIAIMFFSVILIAVAAMVLVSTGFFARPSRATSNASFIILIPLVLFWIVFVIALALITHFMVPVMYRQRCQASEALRVVLRLISENVGVFILFGLFAIVLFMAALMIGLLAMCATCCLAALPYIGTVILLPVYVCLRAFSLFFLRQFGAEYDVWAMLATSERPAVPPPLPV
ncbi:MAG: hypothetical protein QOI34_1062 [Verrucomicrobiota bacterium]